MWPISPCKLEVFPILIRDGKSIVYGEREGRGSSGFVFLAQIKTVQTSYYRNILNSDFTLVFLCIETRENDTKNNKKCPFKPHIFLCN